MKKLFWLFLLCISLSGAVYIQANPSADSDNGQEKSKDLYRQYYDAKIGQIAIVVNLLSNGKSRLVTWMGQGVTLDCGHPEGMDIPLCPAYPVTTPLDTELQGIGQVRLLGILIIHTTKFTGNADVPEAGVYLLAYPLNQDKNFLLMISVDTDRDGRIIYKQVKRLAVKVDKSEVAQATAKSRFPKDNKEASQPGLRNAELELSWPGESYKFNVKF